MSKKTSISLSKLCLLFPHEVCPTGYQNPIEPDFTIGDVIQWQKTFAEVQGEKGDRVASFLSVCEGKSVADSERYLAYGTTLPIRNSSFNTSKFRV